MYIINIMYIADDNVCGSTLGCVASHLQSNLSNKAFMSPRLWLGGADPLNDSSHHVHNRCHSRRVRSHSQDHIQDRDRIQDCSADM